MIRGLLAFIRSTDGLGEKYAAISASPPFWQMLIAFLMLAFFGFGWLYLIKELWVEVRLFLNRHRERLR